MTYFLKVKKEEFTNVLPSILLPTVYENLTKFNGDLIGLYVNKIKENKFISYEIPFSTYLACWRLSQLLVVDIIEEKLSYEKDEMKSSYYFYSDLGADSLDIAELAIYLEKIINARISEKINFKTVSDLTDYVFLIMITRVEKELAIWPNLNEKLFGYL